MTDLAPGTHGKQSWLAGHIRHAIDLARETAPHSAAERAAYVVGYLSELAGIKEDAVLGHDRREVSP